MAYITTYGKSGRGKQGPYDYRPRLETGSEPDRGI